MREDENLLSVFEVLKVFIVKRKYSACVKKEEHEEIFYERVFMCAFVAFFNKLYYNQRMK